MAAPGGRQKGIQGKVDDVTAAVQSIAARVALKVWAHWATTQEKEALIRQSLDRELELKVRPAITALNRFLQRYSLPPDKRWPCPDCGRKDGQQPMRVLEVRVAGEAIQGMGCYLCNMDELLQEGWRALKQLRVQ